MTNEQNENSATESRSALEALLDAFDDALNVRPHLLIEIGYTRPTDWMVHIWDATGVGIAAAPKIIISAQDVSRAGVCREAAEQLRAKIAELERELSTKDDTIVDGMMNSQ